MINSETNVLILGIGNLLWADEGFGVRAVLELNRQWKFGSRVTLIDGGTQGLSLLPHVQAADRMIVFDAIDYGLPPGTLKVLMDDQVPRFMGAKKLSLHQTGFQDVLAIAQLMGGLPSEMVMIGVQPEDFEDYGADLRSIVRSQIQPALQVALDSLGRWGFAAEPRGESEEAPALMPVSLGMGMCAPISQGAAFAPMLA